MLKWPVLNAIIVGFCILYVAVLDFEEEDYGSSILNGPVCDVNGTRDSYTIHL